MAVASSPADRDQLRQRGGSARAGDLGAQAGLLVGARAADGGDAVGDGGVHPRHLGLEGVSVRVDERGHRGGQPGAVVAGDGAVVGADLVGEGAPPHPVELEGHALGRDLPVAEVLDEGGQPEPVEGVEGEALLGRGGEAVGRGVQRVDPRVEGDEVELDEVGVVAVVRETVVDPRDVLDEGVVGDPGAVELDGDLGTTTGARELAPRVPLGVGLAEGGVEVGRGAPGAQEGPRLPADAPALDEPELAAGLPALRGSAGGGDEVVERDVEDLGAEDLEGVAHLPDGREHAVPVEDRGRDGQVDTAEDVGEGAPGLLGLAGGEPGDALPGLGRLLLGAQVGAEPGVLGLRCVPGRELGEPGQGGGGLREGLAVEPGEGRTGDPHPGARGNVEERVPAHLLLDLVEGDPPRVASGVQRPQVLVEQLGGVRPHAAGLRLRAGPVAVADPAGGAAAGLEDAVEPVDELPDDAAPGVAAVGEVEDEVAEPDALEPVADGVEGGALRRHDEDALPVGRERRDEVGDGLRGTGARRGVQEQVGAGAHRLDGLALGRVGIEDEDVLDGRPVPHLGPGSDRDRRQGVREARERGDDVVVGECLALHREVRHEGGLVVREGADHDARVDGEVGHVGAGPGEGGVRGVGVDRAGGGDEPLEAVGVEGDAVLGLEVVDERRVHLELVARLEHPVAAPGVGGPGGAGAQEDGSPRLARDDAAVLEDHRPRRHPDAEEAGAHGVLSLDLGGGVVDSLEARPGLLELGGLADQLGEPGGPAGQQPAPGAEVGAGEVEGAHREVAVPEEGVGPAELDEMARPADPCRGDSLGADGVGVRCDGQVPSTSVVMRHGAVVARPLAGPCVARRAARSHPSRLTTGGGWAREVRARVARSLRGLLGGLRWAQWAQGSGGLRRRPRRRGRGSGSRVRRR